MKSIDGRFEYQDKDGEPLPEGSPLSAVGRFAFQCRSQAASTCSLNIANAGYEIPQRNWRLSGSVDQPSLTPSVNCENCWHGYLQEGVFQNTSHQPESKQ